MSVSQNSIESRLNLNRVLTSISEKTSKKSKPEESEVKYEDDDDGRLNSMIMMGNVSNSSQVPPEEQG